MRRTAAGLASFGIGRGDTVSVIACPVDYAANLQLTNALGELDESLS